MKPVSNWRRVLRYAWSIRLNFLSALFSGLEFGLPYIEEYLSFLTIPRGLFAVFAIITVMLSNGFRLIAQSKISGGLDADQQDPRNQAR